MLRYITDRARPGLVTLYDIRPGNGAGQFLQPLSPLAWAWQPTIAINTAMKLQRCSLTLLSQLEQGTWNVLTFSKVSLIKIIIKITYATLNNIISTIS